MNKLNFFFLPFLALLLITGCNGFISKKTVPQPNQSESPYPETLYAEYTDITDQNVIAPIPIQSANNEDIDPVNTVPINVQSALDEAIDFCEASQELWQKGDLEKAIKALDQAYSLILNIDTEDNLDLTQQKEDLRYLISKRILEIYASRQIALNGNHKAIPIDLNEHVNKEILLFTTGREKKFFLESYRRSGIYQPQFAEALKEAGLPEELSWLPLIESGYKVNALSSARALGLWQFIPSTGYKFGLKRTTYVDERLDPEKATNAAIAYLSELHQLFGDWTTCLAAYNCGEGRVLRVIRSQNVNYLDNFWDLYQRLPRETARYVPRFLATLHIINNSEKYGLDKVERHEPYTYETIMVSKQMHLKNIAKSIGETETTLKRLNPELRHNIVPSGKYALRVPEGKGETLIASLGSIPVASTPTPAFIYHKVRTGETLSTIAIKYRTSIKSIMSANNLQTSNYIVAGKTLKIPGSGYVYSSSSSDAVLPRPSTYTVRRGDSLWIIAKRYGTTTKKIQEVNNLRNTQLQVGQVLKMPGSGNIKIDGLKPYKVRSGDTPYTIALSHKMTLTRFLTVNNLSKRSLIFPGQTLYVE
ncbi:MAG: LysM peptidoglycan-binding domain-containing protein [Desulfobacterales bacterium]|nr:LysM peptidoglycan-binding domain-containing protein [Desulfobacterales bacterium]